MNKGKALIKGLFLWIAILFWSQLCLGQNQGLFDSDEILEVNLKGDFSKLFKNTKGEPQYFDFSMGLGDSSGRQITVPLRVRTRGHFRREMNICDYPPLLLNFSKEDIENTVFRGQDKLKLVMPCQGDRYVLREFYVYKLYNLFTPKSFKVRLVRLNIEDQSEKPKKYDPLLVFLIEEEEQMAQRNQMTSLDKDLVHPERIEPEDFHRMAVFQYLIGNTDWSIQYRQNIKLMRGPEMANPVAVPYDFDHSGIVRAPYALPAPELLLSSVTERRYRGYCVEDMHYFEKTFSEFNSQKEAIYSLYSGSTLLDEKDIKLTLKFLDDFYETINNPKNAKYEFQYPCLTDGTGKIVIKGLK